MAEICTTGYAVVGDAGDVRKVYDFIRNGRVPEQDTGGVEEFFSHINWWDIIYDEKHIGEKDAVLFSLDTKYSPCHECVGAAVYAAVGHRMDISYSSSCIGCGDYRTNDRNECWYVWDYEEQEDYPGVNEILAAAEDVFGRKFLSVDDVNRFARDNVGQDVVFRYEFEEADFGWEKLERGNGQQGGENGQT